MGGKTVVVKEEHAEAAEIPKTDAKQHGAKKKKTGKPLAVTWEQAAAAEIQKADAKQQGVEKEKTGKTVVVKEEHAAAAEIPKAAAKQQGVKKKKTGKTNKRGQNVTATELVHTVVPVVGKEAKATAVSDGCNQDVTASTSKASLVVKEEHTAAVKIQKMHRERIQESAAKQHGVKNKKTGKTVVVKEEHAAAAEIPKAAAKQQGVEKKKTGKTKKLGQN